MKKHYTVYYKERFSELKRELELVSRAAREAERYSIECLSRLEEEKSRRALAEEKLERQRQINAELKAKAGLWERNGRDLHAELVKLKNLSSAHSDALKRIKELEKKLNIRKGTEDPYGLSTPSSKKVNKPNSTLENRAKRGGAKKGHGGHGRKDFTEQEADKVKYNSAPPIESCCNNPLLREVGTVPHAFYNFIPMRLEKVMNYNSRFHCDNCEQDSVALTPNAMPGAKFGNVASSLIVAECYYHQATIGSVARRMGINKGTLIGMAHRYADLLKPLFDQILLELRKEFFLHADETGWSMDGKRAYAWLFANELFRVYLFRDSRGSKVPLEVLGNQRLMLILITDRYCGYIPLLIERQLCFVHIMRDVEKLMKEFPEDAQINAFCNELITHIVEAIKLPKLKLSKAEHLMKATKIQDDIMQICNMPSNDPGIQHIQNIFRINEHQLFHWVKNPDIPCENNFAERHLRPVVISRKISFGCQSEKGMQTREILMTILHTAKCRGHDPASFLENILNILTLNPKADLKHLLFNDANTIPKIA
jgi:hypothetical protein